MIMGSPVACKLWKAIVISLNIVHFPCYICLTAYRENKVSKAKLYVFAGWTENIIWYVCEWTAAHKLLRIVH